MSVALSSLLPGFLSGLAATLVLLTIGHRRKDRLLLVAGACLAWSTLMILPDLHHVLVLPLQVFLAICAMALLLRQTDLRLRALDVAVIAPATLSLVGVAVLPPQASAQLAGALPLLLGLELLAVSLLFLWRRWRLWSRIGLNSWPVLSDQLLNTMLPLLLGSAVGGLFLQWSRLRELPASVSILLGLQAAGLIVIFARRRKEAETRLRETEQQMQDRVAELERHHQQLSDQRLEQVTERERKRIAGDLHDDLGAKLLTIVHTSDSERISTLAREALEEMRLSVRGLTGRPVQLLDAIGDWRAEVVSRLAQSNIEAEWVSLAEDVTHTLPARAYVQTTRIIRESISNVIKHSGGTRCVVRCALADGDFQLVIQDNGKGVPAERDSRLDRGHGMASMKSRAKQMQGQCLVESGPGWGTLIRLTIPL